MNIDVPLENGKSVGVFFSGVLVKIVVVFVAEWNVIYFIYYANSCVWFSKWNLNFIVFFTFVTWIVCVLNVESTHCTHTQRQTGGYKCHTIFCLNSVHKTTEVINKNNNNNTWDLLAIHFAWCVYEMDIEQFVLFLIRKSLDVALFGSTTV